jgi:hypothetical protein
MDILISKVFIWFHSIQLEYNTIPHGYKYLFDLTFSSLKAASGPQPLSKKEHNIRNWHENEGDKGKKASSPMDAPSFIDLYSK